VGGRNTLFKGVFPLPQARSLEALPGEGRNFLFIKPHETAKGKKSKKPLPSPKQKYTEGGTGREKRGIVGGKPHPHLRRKTPSKPRGKFIWEKEQNFPKKPGLFRLEMYQKKEK